MTLRPPRPSAPPSARWSRGDPTAAAARASPTTSCWGWCARDSSKVRVRARPPRPRPRRTSTKVCSGYKEQGWRAVRSQKRNHLYFRGFPIFSFERSCLKKQQAVSDSGIENAPLPPFSFYTLSPWLPKSLTAPIPARVEGFFLGIPLQKATNFLFLLALTLHSVQQLQNRGGGKNTLEIAGKQ